MTHTVNSLLKLADGYVMTYPHGDYKAKRAALQSALTEVLAELVEAQFNAMNFKAELDELTFRKNTSDAAFKLAVTERDTLQSKCEEQAREIERLQEQCNERGRLAIDNGIRMERAEAKVAAMEAQIEHAIGIGPGDWTQHISMPVRVGEKVYLAPGAAQKGCGYEACDCRGYCQQAAPAAAQPLTDDYLESLRDKEFRFSHAIGKEQQA